MSDQQQPTPPPGPGQPGTADEKKKRPKWQTIGAIVVGVIVLGLIGRCMGYGDDATPDPASPSPSESSAAPSSAPPSSAPATSAPAEEQSSSAPEEEPDQDPQEWADGIEEDLLTELQVDEVTDFCDNAEWACAYTGMTATTVGQLHVHEQVADLDRATAEDWARIIFQLVGLQNPDLEWVIIDGAGDVVAGQKSRADIPLLN